MPAHVLERLFKLNSISEAVVEKDDPGTDVLLRRAQHIASLVDQIRDDHWVTELISAISRPGWPPRSDLLMLELTLADIERSAQKLLDLREHVVQEVDAIEHG
jgi:hypothetical protein